MNIEIKTLENTSNKLIHAADSEMTPKQKVLLSIEIHRTANRWVHAYHAGHCNWTTAKDNTVTLDEIILDI